RHARGATRRLSCGRTRGRHRCVRQSHRRDAGRRHGPASHRDRPVRGGIVILVCDVGNTETTLGVYDGETLRAHWRIMTDVPRTADEFGLLLREIWIDDGINPTHSTGAAIASVVPRVTAPLMTACKQWLRDKPVIEVDGRSKLPITLDVEEPLTVGADRIVNTLAASRLFKRDAI